MTSRDPSTTVGFVDLSDPERVAIYLGLMIAVVANVDSLSSQDLRTLGYGFAEDQAFQDSMGGEENLFLAMGPVWDAVKESGDKDAIWELASGDRINREKLQIPLTTAALVGSYFVGTTAIGAAASIGGPITATAGAAKALSQNSEKLKQAMRPAIQLASKWTGWYPSSLLRKIQRFTVRAGAASALVLTPLAFWDQLANLDENEAAKEDVKAEALNSQERLRSINDVEDDETLSGTTIAELRPPGDEWTTLENIGATGMVDVNEYEALELGGRSPEQIAEVVNKGGFDPDDPANPPTGDNVDFEDPLVGDPRIPQEGYTVQDRTRALQPSDPRSGIPKGEPIYRESDYDLLMGSMTEWQIDLFQSRMLRAGYMNENQMTGLMDAKTIETIGLVLFEANANVSTWQEWTNRIAIAGDEIQRLEDEEEKQDRLDRITPFQRNVYLEPDYASLSQTAKNAVEQKLGRKINDWEMEMLVQGQQDNFRGQFDAGESARLMSYKANVRAIEEDLGGGDVFGGGTVQQVDPVSRFEQTFEKQFGKELDRKDVTSQSQSRTNMLMQGLNNAMGAISR